MPAEYLLLLPDGTRDGPYSEEDLLDMLDADELAAGAVCENTDTGKRCRVLDLFRVIPPGPASPATDISDLPRQEIATPAKAQPWVPAPLRPPAPETRPLAAPPPSRVLYYGHPSWWNYWKSGMLSIALMAGGWYAGRWEHGGLWLATGWLSGGFLLALTLFRRASVEYRLTTRRVEVQRGIFSRSSAEIALPDIRAIQVRKQGMPGIFGVGDVIFTPAAEHQPDLVFHQTPGSYRLKNRVRKLQDRPA